jgi:hypothetical protein
MSFSVNPFKLLMILTGITVGPYNSYCQGQSLSCKDLKHGIFYSYPKNTDSKYLYERTGDYQKETDLKKGDTTLWKVKWQNDCTYSIEYVSGNNKINEEAFELLKKKKHKLLFEIKSITDDYYTYASYLDKTSNLPLELDTLWLHEKINPVSNMLFEVVTKESDLHKPRFSDTSKYALLYVYRPGKITNSLAGFPLYFDNNIMCIMKNKSGYIFKILKEGTFEIGSKLMDNSSVTKLDIEFGKKYYVKSIINWGIHATRNFNLEMKVMPDDTGAEEFDKVELNK